jgi:putative oxidoreductase
MIQPDLGKTMARTATLNVWAPRVLSILRIVAALCFMEHGLMKLFHIPAPQARVPAPLPTLLVVAGWIEVIGGGLLVAGLFSRLAALIASGEMAVAYFMMHFPHSPFPALNGGEAAVLYCFIFLYIVFAGPGPWSIDAFFNRRRPLTV